MAVITVGPGAITRAVTWSSGSTLICKDNPANASGTITSVEIYPVINLANCVVGIFYTTNGNTLKCRSSVAIGTVTAGSKQTFDELSLTVETGDYIGIYYTAGNIFRDTSGFAGVWWKTGEYIDPNDEAEYSVSAGEAISLKGIGETPPAVGRSFGFIIG